MTVAASILVELLVFTLVETCPPMGAKTFIATEPNGTRTGSKLFSSELLEGILRGSHFHFHHLIFRLINAGGGRNTIFCWLLIQSIFCNMKEITLV